MSVPRKIDYADARRRRERGETLASIARDYDVTPHAVSYATDTQRRARLLVASALWQKQGRCPVCGVYGTTRHRVGVDSRCRDCASAAQVTTVRPDALRCVTCREWKPDSEFPGDRRQSHRRGRHMQCRPCQTKDRRAYRERRKVPCVSCGAPCLPASEKGARGKDTGLCRTCWHRSRVTA